MKEIFKLKKKERVGKLPVLHRRC